MKPGEPAISFAGSFLNLILIFFRRRFSYRQHDNAVPGNDGVNFVLVFADQVVEQQLSLFVALANRHGN